MDKTKNFYGSELDISSSLFSFCEDFIKFVYGREEIQLDAEKRYFAIVELEKIVHKIREELQRVENLLDPIEYEEYLELLGVCRGYRLCIDLIFSKIDLLKSGE